MTMQETRGHYQQLNSTLLSVKTLLPLRILQGGRVPGECASARELFRVKAREPNTWRFSRVWDKSKTMRRHDPGEVTEKITGSPGGATSSGADGVLAGLF